MIESDRRKHIRAYVDFDVLLAKRSENGWIDAYTARAKNISRRGICIETDDIIPPGKEVCVQFNLPNISAHYCVNAKVIWARCDDAVRAMGLLFTDIGEQHEEMIEHYVLKKYNFANPFPTSPGKRA
jgi:Tfp pilus assembly protein PilZ